MHKGDSSSVLENPKDGRTSNELEKHKLGHSSSEPVKHKRHSSSVLESPEDTYSLNELEKYKGHSSSVIESPEDSHSSSKVKKHKTALTNSKDFESHVSESSKQNQSRRVLRFTADRKRPKLLSKKDPNNRSQALSATVSQNSCACDICGKQFRYKSSLQLHERNHCYTKPFKCWECKRSFLKKSGFTKHLRGHINTGVGKDSSGSSVKDLNNQSQAISGKLTKNSCSCDICDKVFKHKKSYTPVYKKTQYILKTYKCSICKKVFNDKSSYNSHLKKHRSTKGGKHSMKSSDKNLSVRFETVSDNISQNPLASTICGEVFSSISTVRNHTKYICELKMFKCPICNLAYKQSEYDDHIKVHNNGCVGEHTVSASVEESSVKSSAKNLNSQCKSESSETVILPYHMRRAHANVKPYKCDICKNDFSDSSSLGLHVRTKHPNEVEKNRSGKSSVASCAVSSETFPSRGDLLNHLRKYSCKLCNKQFMFKTDFYIHVNTKHGKKASCENYLVENSTDKSKEDSHASDKIDKEENKCVLCKNMFPDVDALQKHQAVAHVGEFHPCNICQRVFHSEHSLTLHYSAHTGGKTVSSSVGKEGEATSQGGAGNIQQHFPRTNSNQCKSCKKTFQNPSYYLQHRMKHCKYVRFNCHVCDKKINNPSEFAKHMQSVHGISKPFNCDECGKNWTIYCSFERHMLIQHEKLNVFQCKFCYRNFVYRKSFIFHLKNAHKLISNKKPRERNVLENRELESGKKQINNNSDLNRNSAWEVEELTLKQQSNENDNSEGSSSTISLLNSKIEKNEQKSSPLLCYFCNQDFKSYYLRKKHMQEFHERYNVTMTRNKSKSVNVEIKNPRKCKSTNKFPNHSLKTKYMKPSESFSAMCRKCKRVFCIKFLYDKHILLCHKKRNKNYKVKETVNNVSLNQKALEKDEAEVNVEKKPFACHICQRVFRLRMNLARHFVIHKRGALAQEELSRKKFSQCKACKKRFSSRGQYLGHLTRYCKYEPLVCRSCKTSFSNPSEFGAHMREAHNILKPYECNLCNTRCSLYINLAVHRLSHEKYYCSLCIETFSTIIHFNSHMKKVHKLDSYQSPTKSNNLENQEIPSEEKLIFACPICKLKFYRKHLYIKHVGTCQNGKTEGSVATSEANLTSNTENVKLKELLENENHGNESTGLQEGRFFEDLRRKKRNAKSFVCNLCLQRFKSNYFMTKHLKTFHGIEASSATCKKCKQVFSRKRMFAKHVKICQKLEEDRTSQEKENDTEINSKTTEDIEKKFQIDEKDEFLGSESPKEGNFRDIDCPLIENCDEIKVSKEESLHDESDGEYHFCVDDLSSDSESSSLLLSSQRENLNHMRKVTVTESQERETVLGDGVRVGGNGIDNCNVTTQDAGFNEEECMKFTEQKLSDEINICEKSSARKHIPEAMSHEAESGVYQAFSVNENKMERHIPEQKRIACFSDFEQYKQIKDDDDINVQLDESSFEDFGESFIPEKNENSLAEECRASPPKQCQGIYNSSKKSITTQRKSSFGSDCSKYNSGLQPYMKSVEKKFLPRAKSIQDVPHVTARNLKIAYANSYEISVIDVWMKH